MMSRLLIALPSVAAALAPTYMIPATATADYLLTCQYNNQNPNGGFFNNEAWWQSGNTIESLSNMMVASGGSLDWTAQLNLTYLLVAPVVDNCFDDHQWWMLAWIRAYEATSDTRFIIRAAQIFDYVVQYGWTDSTPEDCGGGILWCPAPSGVYKNSVTNELFLTSAMRLHPYEAIVGRPSGFYLSWAVKEWDWFARPGGMIGSNGLINDGLTNTCGNNGQTTWTYNQGVLLDGLGLLYQATGNTSYLTAAQSVITAVMTQLTTPQGVLVEPCGGSCDGDQHIFKGIFVRHLSRLQQQGVLPQAFAAQVNAFLLTNANAMLSNATCASGGYSMAWQGPCAAAADTAYSASQSSAMDLLLAAAIASSSSSGSAGAAALASKASSFTPLGLGNCVDGSGQSMPNCWATNISQAACAAAAAVDAKAVAYDYNTPCPGVGPSFCRVRTLSGAGGCPSGWQYAGGPATTVTAANGAPLTTCVLKGQ